MIQAGRQMGRCSRARNLIQALVGAHLGLITRSLLLFVLAAPVEPAQFKIQNQTFTLPEGFEIELVAGPPLVDRPIVADFDERGRLYVADSAGVNDKVEKQLQDKPHRIIRLEDADGDGRFERSTVFADKMMFPEGVLWFDGAVYSGAPPTIWKLEDTDEDGIADRRSEWFKGGTLTGCANDLHGPYLGPDGWIYWCKGAFAKQTHERPGRPTISDSAAHIFRCRPDGSEFDSLMSGGMDNPVEIAFTEEGEAIFTTTFYTNPQAGQRDALVHAIYGGVYPKVHGVLDGLKRTGDLMPALTHLGPAVPSGLIRYASAVFGAEFKGNLFSTQFNLHKVQRHLLNPQGATFQTRDLDFLVSDNPDFHPTDVLEDADGSLLVVDTGGWYKLCCPTSQLAKPDVLGAIYRIRRKGAPAIEDPRGLNMEWTNCRPGELVARLDDPRPAVRNRAISLLAKQGVRAVPRLSKAMKKSRSIEARRNSVWALTRIDGPAARTAARLALSDPDPGVQQAAVHSVGMHRDAAAIPQLLKILNSSSPHLQRNAATALSRIGDSSAVPGLLAAASIPLERVMEHALIYALIEIDDRDSILNIVNQQQPQPSSHQRRAALIALDQMDHGSLTPDLVIPHLTLNDPVLKETGSWIVSHHPEWGGEMRALYQKWLEQEDLPPTRREEIKIQLAQFGRNPVIQEFISQVASEPSYPLASRLLVLGAMALTPLKETPIQWIRGFQQSLADPNEPIVRLSVAALRALPPLKTNAAAISQPLLALARDSQRPADLRLEALAAIPAPLDPLEPELFSFLLAALDPAQPLVRTTAAGILGRAHLSEDQLMVLSGAMAEVGPLEISKLLGAYEHTSSQTVGLTLIEFLKKSKSSAALRPDLIRPLLKKFPAPVQEQGEELLNLLNADLANQRQRLDDLNSALLSGDIRRGQAIFNSPKTACVTCHQIGYIGGKIGPDLTRIGSIRTERDLLESILFPSASFVRSYEPMIVVTKQGEEYAGVMRQESAESLFLVSGAGAEQRLAMADIAEVRPGTISVMPDGLDQQLNRQELADLIVFLKSLK